MPFQLQAYCGILSVRLSVCLSVTLVDHDHIGRIESTESHVILGGGVAVCLLLSAHRTVIFAIAQLSCYSTASHGYNPRTKSAFSHERRDRDVVDILQ